MNGIPASTPSSSVQSNGLPSPPGRVASAARARRTAASRRPWHRADRRQIGALGDRQRLHHRQAEARAHHHDPLRRLLAVQLQHVGLERLDDVAQRLVIGIDGERDLAGAALDALAERARRLDAEMARARRKEHEADHVGAGFQRDIKRFGGLQAADFDHERHAPAFYPLLRPRPQSASGGGRRNRQRRLRLALALAARASRRGGATRTELARAARARRRRARRAARRHLPCRSQAATPPISTPRMSTMKMTTNSGSVTA